MPPAPAPPPRSLTQNSLPPRSLTEMGVRGWVGGWVANYYQSHYKESTPFN